MDWIICSSGSETSIGLVVGMMSVTSSVEIGKKCPVVPVWAIVLWIVAGIGAGGSTCGIVVIVGCLTVLFRVGLVRAALLLLFLFVSVDSRLSYSRGVAPPVVLLEASRRGGL